MSYVTNMCWSGKPTAATPTAIDAVPKNYFKMISENKDVTRGIMMLGSCVQSVKTYVAKALADLNHFSFLYLDDKEKYVEACNFNSDIKIRDLFADFLCVWISIFFVISFSFCLLWITFLFNLVTAHVIHLWSLLLVHLPGPLWKSLVAFFGMLHLVYGSNSPLIFASLVRYSLLQIHLPQMAVHHLHHHIHHLHLLLLVQSFILNLRLGSLANPFLHRPFPFLPDWFHRLGQFNVFILLNSLICFMVC